MKVSVIVPVHRVPEGLLRDCLDSLRMQVLSDLEILCVLDGGDDPALPALKDAARQDCRIRVLVNERHGGVSVARNRGLDAACGAWVGFVDADDRVEPEMYAHLVKEAESADADLAGCRMTYGLNRMDEPLAIPAFAGVWNLSDDADAARVHMRAGLSCCTKLFARERIGTLRFLEDVANLEDGLFLHRFLSGARRAVFLDRAYYLATRRPDSAQHRAMGMETFRGYYFALGQLAQAGAARASGRPVLTRAWGWTLLAWSVGNRRYHDELPGECREGAAAILRQYSLNDLQPFRSVYPGWLRHMLDWKLADPQRLFGGSLLFYSLLWLEIRRGTAALRGESCAGAAMNAVCRLLGRGRAWV